MRARIGGSFEDIESGVVRVGNVWKTLSSVRVYEGGAWKEGKAFIPALSLAISPPTVSATRSGPGVVTTALVSATPTGGRAPYTYAWTRTSGVGSATTPTSASTAFTATLGIGDDTFGDFRCTVTDDLGTTAIANITAFFTSNDPTGD